MYDLQRIPTLSCNTGARLQVSSTIINVKNLYRKAKDTKVLSKYSRDLLKLIYDISLICGKETLLSYKINFLNVFFSPFLETKLRSENQTGKEKVFQVWRLYASK